MSAIEIQWPKKTREIVSSSFDSTRWNNFPFRDDDIIIDTWGKSGTTWTQQIISQLVLGPDAGLAGDGASPWIDMSIIPFEPMLAQIEAQKHRRFLKSHLPLDALVFSPRAKYIFVARDARDVIWSLYNHLSNYTDLMLDAFNGRRGPDEGPIRRPNCDVKAFYLRWLETGELDGSAAGDGQSFWPHMQGWWDARRLPNVLLVHFARLKADLRGEMERIAGFLDIRVDDASWPALLEHCSFDYMRAQAAKIDQLEMAFKGGGKTFINKGTNGRWKDVLTPAEIARCDEVMAEKLTPDCAHWLATGEMPKE